MLAPRYYALISSLPHLAHFERLDRLPINAQRLRSRRSMLEREDRLQLDAAVELVWWHEHPATETDLQIVRQYHRACAVIEDPALRELVDYRMGLRSVLAAMRRRSRGEGPPLPGERWGTGLGAAQIPARWEHPDFKLASLFPWLPQARELFDAGEAAELERLLADVLWRRLVRMGEADPFGFPAVCSYVFRWDIAGRWLAHDPVLAERIFKDLVQEVTREHQQIFGK